MTEGFITAPGQTQDVASPAGNSCSVGIWTTVAGRRSSSCSAGAGRCCRTCSRLPTLRSRSCSPAWIPYPVGGTLLEMGSGTGVTAVSAALAGCLRVTALDISSAAVQNTQRNAERHGVADRVDVRHSDLFDALSAGERFDLIYWNSNFVEAPSDFVNASDLHHAFFDPGYETHRRYLLQAPYHLSERGRLLLGFSDLGSWEHLRTACSAAGLTAEVLRAQRCQLETSIEFQLVELRPADGGPWTKRRREG